MIITGLICLCDKESIIDCKRYLGRDDRDKIILNWRYKHDSLIIIPDTEFDIPSSGTIKLCISNKTRISSIYNSLEERKKILEHWIDFYNLNEKSYTIKICPND